MEDVGLNMLDGDEPEKPSNEAPKGAEAPATSFDLAAGMMVNDQDMRALAGWSVKYRLDDLDPLWGGFIAAKVSYSASVAAGQAALAVQAGVAAIPDQIYAGAVRAGDEIKSNLIHGIRAQGVEVGQALRLTITDAANKGAVALKAAATELDVKVGKIPLEVQTQIDAYKQKGAAEFAATAKAAALAAVQANLWAQLSRSAIVSIMAFLFACGVGAGGLWGYLLLTHQIMPAGVIAVSDPLRGSGTLVSIPNGGTPVHNCNGGLCVYYKAQVPELP